MQTTQVMRSIARCIMLGCLLVAVDPLEVIFAAVSVQDSQQLWHKLVSDAKALRLPTKFIEDIPAGFVRVEFQDLRTFAAEYHPEDHRMVLSRALSFNGAGGVLRPLHNLTNKDLQTIYHELFHAFMDSIESRLPPESRRSALIAFAREQQRCRYEHVWITPIPQNKGHVEERFLDEVESWEALNETWAVFIGWAVWTQLEILRSRQASPSHTNQWADRLRSAEADAELRGYYEPRDPAEKVMTQKRYLAPISRISASEVAVIMKEVLGSSADRIQQSIRVMNRNHSGMAPALPCTTTPDPP